MTILKSAFSGSFVRFAGLCLSVTFGSLGWASDDEIKLSLRSQQPEAAGSDRFAYRNRDQVWKASQTAVIVCDMWDSHHCYRAVLRENQMVPRMNAVLSSLRDRGVTIIHAPSSCVGSYDEHPARRRVLEVPKVDPPQDINTWCYSIPAEESAKYPLDQSDGGEDDTPEEHAAWVKQLQAQGRNPEAPWRKQHPGLTIDGQRDFISDKGEEVWNILQAGGIKNVILLGVHTNMCVLGRPFGLRQMAKNDVNVVLMRDLTDSMYNPKAWPYVSHQEGTALIISHIERYVCPTITSAQILGGQPFAFTPIGE